MTQENIEKIKYFKKQMALQMHEKNELWEIYLHEHGRYPNGEKSCSRCLTDVLENLFAIAINQPVPPSVEEQFSNSVFKPGNHEKPEVIKKKRVLNIDKPDKFEEQ